MSLAFKPFPAFLSLVFVTSIVGSHESHAQSLPTGQSEWQSSHFRQHELVGKIWSTKAQKFVEWQWLRQEVKSARFLLLGEIHNNSDHHLLQAQLLGEMKPSSGQALRLVVEMIPPSLDQVYNSFQQTEVDPRKSLAKLGLMLKWKQRGWGEWEKYSPIFNVAVGTNAKVFTGNIDRKDVKRIGFKGLSATSQSEKTKWSLHLAYTAGQQSRLAEILYQSHCKFVPKTALAPMALVQQVRDGVMARSMLGEDLRKSKRAVSVLIAGSGHVRNDLAVPRILRAKAPTAKIITVSFTEVTPDHKKPQQYEPQSADNAPVFDYLFFTPKFEIKDHCAGLAKRFGKHKVKQPTK